MIAFAAIAVIGVVAFLVLRSKKDTTVTVDEGPVQAPMTQDRSATAPDLPFVDITLAAGIDFEHESGARGEKFLPETMGGGCAIFDYDNDGDPDLLFVNGRSFADSDPGAATTRLYSNDGKGHFTDVTAETGVGVSFHGMGVAIGDIDNDGDRDIYLTGVGERFLLENTGGSFRDITASSGTSGDPADWSTAATFFDADQDGDLDLYVGNYVRWSKEIDFEIDFQLTGVGRAYGPPMQYPGADAYLFRNDGDLKFTDISESAGVRIKNPATGSPMGKALGVLPIDLDGDHLLDLVVANDTVQNFVLHNRGDGTFDEIGSDVGLGFNSDGAATGAMGIDAACFRDPDTIGIAVGNFANEMSSLYVDQKIPDEILYTDEAISEGIGPSSRLMLSFGLFFFDVDLDGRQDLLQANGHLESEIHRVQPSQQYKQPPQLFWNAGADARRAFTPLSNDKTGEFGEAIAGRAAAYADVDGDGDLDVLFTQVGARPRLLRNDQELPHHFIRFALQDETGNRDAIGAWIEIDAGGQRQRQPVLPTRSYLTQVEPKVTFGIGTATQVDSARIIWPDGATQDVEVTKIDGETLVRRE